MISATSTRAALRNTASMVLVLSLLCLSPLPTPAGELSQAPPVSPPGFSLPDLEGRPRSLGEFTGKVVLVTFWASWCRPCIEEMPSIKRLAATMADHPFTVVGVNVGEGERRAQAAAARLGIGFPILLDKDSTIFKAWGADVLPTAYLLDRGGHIRYIARGPVEWDRDDIIGMLKQMTAERPPGGE